MKKILTLFVAGMLLFTGCSKNNNPETVAFIVGTMEQTVTETGIVVFDDSYAVSSVVSAKIISESFSEGDIVKKGQALYRLDSKDIRDKISQTNISLEKANEAHRQSLNAVNDLMVKSFVSGLVTKVYCNVGDYVSPGTKIADVVDKQNLILQVPFNISSMDGIFTGGSAEVIMDFDGSVISGTISKIFESPEPLDGRQVGINIEISITNPGALKQGDVAFAKIGNLASVTSGSLKNKTEQFISSTGMGQVTELRIKEGENVYSDIVVMIIKNDALHNAVNTAALNIKEIKNTISQLNAKLPDFEVLSPVSGVVTEKTAKVGDLASAGVPLAVLADNGELYLEVLIDEMYIKDISAGQRATAVIQGSDNHIYEGRVIKIDDSGTAKNGVTYYKVRLALDNQEGLMEAMNMDVKIITSTKEKVNMIPIKALKGNKVKILTEKNKIIEQEVTVGIKNKEYAEILDGLLPTDNIIVEGDVN